MNDLDDEAGDSEMSSSDTSSSVVGDVSDRVETVDTVEDDFLDLDLGFLTDDDDDANAVLVGLSGVVSTESPSDATTVSSTVRDGKR